MKKERILYLDVMRIIGFLAVTAFHFATCAEFFGIQSGHLDLYVGFNSFRWAPVAFSCFFMVSGAALFYQYGKEFHLKEYYKRRFLGIYPLFWLAYLLAFLENFYYMRSIPEVPKITFLLTVIGMDHYLQEYIPNFALIGEWFLGVIIILYILFPLYRLVMRKNKYILPVVFMGAGIWLTINNPFPMLFEKNPLVCSMYFVIGMFLEMLRENPDIKAVTIGRRIAAAVGVGVFIAVYIIERKHHIIPSNYRVFMLSISLYLIVMEISTWIRSERAKKVIIVIGRHSFAFYLVHHVFLRRYLEHFSGTVMSGTNTLVLFLSAVGYIYLLALGLDKLHAYLTGVFRRERLVTKSR